MKPPHEWPEPPLETGIERYWHEQEGSLSSANLESWARGKAEEILDDAFDRLSKNYCPLCGRSRE